MIDLASRPSLRVDQVMALKDVSRRTVYYWIARGRVDTVPGRRGYLGTRIYADRIPERQKQRRRPKATT